MCHATRESSTKTWEEVVRGRGEVPVNLVKQAMRDAMINLTGRFVTAFHRRLATAQWLGQMRDFLEAQISGDFDGTVRACFTEKESLGPNSAVKYRFEAELQRRLPAASAMTQTYVAVLDFLHVSRRFKIRFWRTSHCWKDHRRDGALVAPGEVKKLPPADPNDREWAFEHDLLRLGPSSLAVRDPDTLTQTLFDAQPLQFVLLSDQEFQEVRGRLFGRAESEQCFIQLLDSPAVLNRPPKRDFWDGKTQESEVIWLTRGTHVVIRLRPDHLLFSHQGDVRCRPLNLGEWEPLAREFDGLYVPPKVIDVSSNSADLGSEFLSKALCIRSPMAWDSKAHFLVRLLEMLGMRFVVRQMGPEGDKLLYRQT